MRFEKVAIIGVGLIGGSIGLAIKRKGLARVVAGVGRRRSSIRRALRCGAIDMGTLNLEKGVAGADLVLIATPVCSIPKIVKSIAAGLKRGAVLTDVGSTKAAVVKAAERAIPPGIAFVGSHPLAGSEKRGVGFAKADLLEGATVIITKTKKTKSSSIGKLERFWRSLGAERVKISSPEKHDKIVAEISHLPHVIATALVNSVSRESLAFASAGFRDTTRIAASDPEVWRDICVTNKRQILKSLGRYERSISRLKALIRDDRKRTLQREFAKAKHIREKL